VLQALQDAEDSLAQFRGQRGALQSRIEAERAATVAAGMVRQRQVRGAASVIDLLDSERQRVSAQQQLAQAYAQVANGYVAIAKSMGLGWHMPPGEDRSANRAR
jgi:outer membrane protein TolC